MKKITFTAILLTIGMSTQLYAYNTINTQLDLGERNSDVTNLQDFLKDNSSIYPEGLVTGYFGGMTRSGVQRFQTLYGIVSSGSAASTGYGRVGPSTRDKINSLINNGGWNNTTSSDTSGPYINSVSQTTSQNSATFTWNTNENATAKIFYSTIPVTMNEGDINSLGFGSTSGFTATNDNISRTSQQIIINGLSQNTTYYYTIVSTDLSGNVSVFGPNNTFRTNSQ